MILRNILLWFRLANHRSYETSLAAINSRIDDLVERQHEARDAGRTLSAADLLVQIAHAQAGRDNLSASYLELAGRKEDPNTAG